MFMADYSTYTIDAETNLIEASADNFGADIAAVNGIKAVPTILEVICRTTGMGFAAIARVTEDRWIACAVRDEIQFGLRSGRELPILSTIANTIRQNRQAVVINNVADDETYNAHPISAMYGFQSYIAMPITLSDGTFFGTLARLIHSQPA
jgi:GAF domain-containing protein